MRSITVCVDLADVLMETLPYNAHHFSERWIVTASRDTATIAVAEHNGCKLHVTNAFYEGGADFNKWKALEEGLDAMGRTGWLCLLDCDILWPKGATVYHEDAEAIRFTVGPGRTFTLPFRCLSTPRRRMAPWPIQLPSEDRWISYPLHRNEAEFAGYCQVFHAEDPCLGPAPWHDVTWRHAGGADSFFQRKWETYRKARPPWEVLHLGPCGVNWCGTNEESRRKLREVFRRRREGSGYSGERL